MDEPADELPRSQADDAPEVVSHGERAEASEEGCGQPKARHADGDNSELRLRANVSVSMAAIQTAIGVWRAQVDVCSQATSSGAAELAELMGPISRAVTLVFGSKDEAASLPGVTGKLLPLMASLIAAAVRGCTLVRLALRGATRAAPRRCAPLAAWLGVWRPLVPLVRGYCAWLQREAPRWHVSARRKVPAALYACERLQSQLSSLLLSPTCAAHVKVLLDSRATDGGGSARGNVGTSHAEPAAEGSAIPESVSCGTVAADGEGHAALMDLLTQDWGEVPHAASRAAGGAREQAQSTAAEHGLSSEATVRGRGGDAPPPRGASRRKLRSRNPYIDAELSASRTFDDSFADLEDFIVVKRGRKY